MSRIPGLNDEVTLRDELAPPKPDIKVWKGTRKTANGIGKNLNSKLRLQISGYAHTIIKNSYETTASGDDLLVDSLNIIPAYEDEKKTFRSQMAGYKGVEIQRICDRVTIHTEFVDAPNKVGSHYRQPVVGEKECPVKGTNHDCPLGCKLNGDFYFYILELALAGSSQLCRLRTHALDDNKAIAKVLDAAKVEIGAIKKSPFFNEETRTYSVYRLARQEVDVIRPVVKQKIRTGGKYKATDWVISLELHPIWKSRYDSWQLTNYLQSQRLSPSRGLLESVYGSNSLAPAIDVEYQVEPEPKKLAASPTATPLVPQEVVLHSFDWEEVRQEVLRVYRENHWQAKEFQQLIINNFNRQKFDESWHKEDCDRLLELLRGDFKETNHD